MKNISGKRVLITGGASGLGRRLALKMAAAGARVAVCDIDAAGLDGLQQATGGAVACVTADLSRRENVAAMAAEVQRRLGGVDILVNNAGVVSGKPLLECSDEEIERTVAVNLMAHFWTIRAFLPGMQAADSGHVVTIASAAGIVGVARLADYSATKFACFGLDEALRNELRRSGSAVRTTVVCPYYINTGMFAGVKTRFSWLLPILDEEKVARRILRAISRRRRRLLMPPLVYLIGPLRLLPVGGLDAIADLLGVHRTMDHFRGRGHHG